MWNRKTYSRVIRVSQEKQSIYLQHATDLFEDCGNVCNVLQNAF
jgi:hypothetical protein